MAMNSKIGWTDHTQNFWGGCNKVSAECQHCYIDAIMRRAGREPFMGPIRTKTWGQPRRWNRIAQEQGRRFKVFTCSMSDFFHPGADQWRPEAWDVIKQCPNLDWLVLTKRPELILERLPGDWGTGYPNVWLGVTCGIATSVHRVDTLMAIPAALRWISAEPLLGPIDFRPYLGNGVDWVITGCEQAHRDKRREMDLDWVRDIDQQCREAGVAHFMKQRYVGTQITADGVLDGKKRQEWPRALRLRATV